MDIELIPWILCCLCGGLALIIFNFIIVFIFNLKYNIKKYKGKPVIEKENPIYKLNKEGYIEKYNLVWEDKECNNAIIAILWWVTPFLPCLFYPKYRIDGKNHLLRTKEEIINNTLNKYNYENVNDYLINNPDIDLGVIYENIESWYKEYYDAKDKKNKVLDKLYDSVNKQYLNNI